MRPWRRLPGVLSVGFWVVMMVLLVQRQQGRTTLTSRPELPLSPIEGQEDSQPEDTWMGIYFQDSKIGWIHHHSTPLEDGFLIREESVMHLKVLNTQQRVRTTTRCRTDSGFALRSFTFRMTSEAVAIRVSGEFREGELHLKILSGGREQEKVIPFRETPYLFVNLRPYLARSGLEVGQSFRFPVLLPSTLGHADAILTVEAEEDVEIHGELRRAFRVTETYSGIEVVAWYDRTGRVLKELSPMGFVMIREDPELAMTGVEEGEGAVDIITSTRVPVRRTLSDPAALTYLRLLLKGVEASLYDLDGGRQEVRGETVEIVREDLARLPPAFLPVSDPDLEPFLRPTPFLQSADERIRRLAREIVGGERELQAVARRLMEWVYANLEKRPTVSLPSALDVLDLGAGDCNEHAVLMAALGRAAGLPTRVVVGIVYAQDGFYYHAWTEVWVGDWVSLDPVMAQFPADVTHVRFIEGGLEEQIRMAQVVGRLSLEILEFR